MVKIASKKTTLSTGENTESFLIQAMSQVFTYHNEQPDFTDDCAYYQNTLPQVMSTDSICEGVHFDRKWDSLLQIGAQAAVVNLSDIAASGGQAHTLLWSLSIPPTWQVQEVIELATGFAQVAHRYHVRIRGGNLCIRPGPLEIHVTALGQTHQVIHRKGMQDQDRIYVTGYLGQRALGYLYPSQFTRTLRHQWYPHLEESQQLQQWGKVHSMMDISDGLLQECYRLAQLNYKHIDLHSDSIPVSEAYQKVCGDDLRAALGGGEDYVLLFTAPSHLSPPSSLHAYPIGVARDILHDQESPQVFLDHQPIDAQGYIHQLDTWQTAQYETQQETQTLSPSSDDPIRN